METALGSCISSGDCSGTRSQNHGGRSGPGNSQLPGGVLGPRWPAIDHDHPRGHGEVKGPQHQLAIQEPKRQLLGGQYLRQHRTQRPGWASGQGTGVRQGHQGATVAERQTALAREFSQHDAERTGSRREPYQARQGRQGWVGSLPTYQPNRQQ